MQDTVPRLITLVDLAERLRVSPHTIRSWVQKGRLRPIRLCRRLLFHPDEIARFLTENSSDRTEVAKLRTAAESVRVPYT
jgi:excisionase family DNA binding protein